LFVFFKKGGCKMKKKLIILISLLLVATIIFTGCVPGADKDADTNTDTGTETPAPDTDKDSGEKILKTNNQSEPGSLDPALAQGTHESWVLNHTFEGLMKLDENGELAPGMAERYELSDDDLTYTFTLKDDVKWSNGDPVTAHDFEFAWKRAIDPELAADYAFQIFYVKGAEAYNAVEKPGKYKDPDDETKEIIKEILPGELDGLDTTGKSEDEINDMVYKSRLEKAMEDVAIKALDDKTLEVTLESPTGYFLELTAFYTYFPVNKAVVEGNADWAKNADTHGLYYNR
jgi:oligopeptide transport system substrate-binding protein